MDYPIAAMCPDILTWLMCGGRKKKGGKVGRSGKGKMIRTLVADDSSVIVEVLKNSLATMARFELVGVATDGLEAVSKATELKPDLLLMDIHMPGIDGLRATGIIKDKPNAPKVVIMTLYDDEVHRKAALKAQADGFCGKLDLQQGLLI